MEKISCDVILDLLPLYCDDVCSKDSRMLVDNHLKGCPDCSQTLRQMKTEYRLSNAEEQNHEAVVRNLAATWQNTVKKTFLRGTMLALCICALLFGAYWSLTRLLLVMVPTDKMQISVGTVTEQSVQIFLKTTDHKKVSYSSSHTTADGKCYLLVKRGVIATEDAGEENWECVETISRTGVMESGDKVPITEIYYGTEKDSVLIWKADAFSAN